MRNEQSWKERAFPKVLKSFPPRLQEDLQKISVPKNLPELKSSFIHGPVHSGKTVLAGFMMLEACKQRFLNATTDTIIFLKIIELLHDLRSCFNGEGESEKQILEKYSEADFLVLDDFGNEKPTDWVLSVLYLLIDRRYENMKTTIFTSNHSLKDIAQKFGDDRITSRIERMCGDGESIYKKPKFK